MSQTFTEVIVTHLKEKESLIDLLLSKPETALEDIFKNNPSDETTSKIVE